MTAWNQFDSFGAESNALESYRILTAAGYGTEADNWRPDLAPDNRGPEFFGLEGAAELDEFNEFGGWNPFRSIKRAVSSVARVAGKIPGMSTITAPIRLARNVAQGKNVWATVKSTGSGIVRDTRSALPIAAGVVSFVPGVGTGVASGLSAVSAISQGKNLREIAEEAAIGAVPGGAIYKAAIQTGIDVARGKNVLKTVVNRGVGLARTQLPGGQLAQSALNVGLNIAQGRNVAKSLASESLELARRQLPQSTALNVAQRALSAGINVAQGGNVLSQVVQAAPLGKLLTNSPLVKVGPYGAALQFPAVGVPAAAAIAATTAVAEAAESTVPGVSAAARQVIANTRDEANRGNKGAEVALGAIKQAIEQRMALREAKSRAQPTSRRMPASFVEQQIARANALRAVTPAKPASGGSLVQQALARVAAARAKAQPTSTIPAGYRRALVGPSGQIVWQ